jgi:hypothetical protein
MPEGWKLEVGREVLMGMAPLKLPVETGEPMLVGGTENPVPGAAKLRSLLVAWKLAPGTAEKWLAEVLAGGGSAAQAASSARVRRMAANRSTGAVLGKARRG